MTGCVWTLAVARRSDAVIQYVGQWPGSFGATAAVVGVDS